MSVGIPDAAGGNVVVADRLCKDFAVGRNQVLRAVNDVSFTIGPGETLGLAGESGSGKSTTGRMLVGMLPPTSGQLTLFGEHATGRAMTRLRQRVQFVFQDPMASLDPRMRVGASIAEPLTAAGGMTRRDRLARVAELLAMVGLPRDSAERFPHEFSGGQRQRVVIARALALRPAFIVCDEPVSALDVSMQAQIVNLLLDLQDRFGLSYLFVAHDLAVTRCVSTRVAVMYAGRIVEIAPRRDLYDTPLHPYTQALLEAVPRPDPNAPPRATIAGEMPSLLYPPPGCIFAGRCPHVMAVCRQDVPLPREAAPGHTAACHLY
jgi:oligopeptide/dipeptide ABC transporter ATP-binding protein